MFCRNLFGELDGLCQNFFGELGRSTECTELVTAHAQYFLDGYNYVLGAHLPSIPCRLHALCEVRIKKSYELDRRCFMLTHRQTSSSPPSYGPSNCSAAQQLQTHIDGMMMHGMQVAKTLCTCTHACRNGNMRMRKAAISK